MNRGSLGITQPRPSLQDTFNEAPIHESGKYLRPIFQPLAHVEPSMRPRFMNRGSNEADG